MGADLDDDVDPEPGKRLDGGTERDLLPGLSAPIGAVQARARLHLSSGQTAHDHDLGFGHVNRVEIGLELIERRVHQVAVVGRAGPQTRRTHVLRLEVLEHRLDVALGAADRLVGAVVRRHAQAGALARRVVLFDRRTNDIGAREHDGHGALLGQRGDQVAAPGREAQAFLQGEYARGLCRRDLAEAVSDHDARSYPILAQRALSAHSRA